MSDPSAARRGLQLWLGRPAIGVGLVGLLLYLPTLGFGLVNLDDPWLVERATLLREPSVQGLRQIWLDLSIQTRLHLGAEYLPVRDISVMLDHALFGDRYGGHHLTSVLLYALLCALGAQVILRWLGRVDLAWTAGLIFAVHPLHVESVAWLSERKGLLAGVFVMATALAYHRFLARPSTARWALTALPLVLGVWSKAIGITAVGLVAALCWFTPRRQGGPGSSPRVIWGALAGLALVGLLAFLPVGWVGNSLVLDGEHRGLVASTALMARALGIYARQLVLGGAFGIEYAVEEAGLGMGLIGAATAAALLALALVGAWRTRSFLSTPAAPGSGPTSRAAPGGWTLTALAAACFWIFFLPVSQLVVPLQNALADRYMLLPLWALSLLVALGLARLSLRPLRLGLLALVVVLAGMTTVLQTRSWSSSRALHEQALLADPHNVAAMLQLAGLDRAGGDLQGAWRWLRRAERLRPASSAVLMQRALLLDRQGRTREAIQLLERAAGLDGRADKVRANLALLLHRTGRTNEALRWARRAVAVRPLVAHNQRSLGVVALAHGRLDEAEAALVRARELEPGNAQNHVNLGVIYLRRGLSARALECLSRAVHLDPTNARARRLLRDAGGGSAAAKGS